MAWHADIAVNSSSFSRAKEAIQKFANIDHVNTTLSKELPTHRELVEKVYKYGFPKL